MKDKENKSILNNFKITDNDLDYVISYIKDRQTAILVIMFTDIVGFTRITEEKGEKYAATLRAYHDDILTKVIEKNNSGKVIKYIGDSVMAVFSEPTKAVEISLEIQDQLKKFNKSNPDMTDIDIRIGLHMGQVAIENHIQSDIFGRHVNRASRIESLAGKGQVFVSFPVFDSAKGWLQDVNHLGWKFHGEYYLKGIDKPSEIYEVFDKHKCEPAAPKKGKRRRIIPSYIFIVLFMLAGSLVTLGLQNIKRTQVYLFDFKYEDVRTLEGEKLFLDGEVDDNKRLLLTELKKGRNVLYYDVSAMVRYYTEIDVRRGTNLIEPEFDRLELPQFDFRTDFSETDIYEDTIDDSFSYYNDLGEKVFVKTYLKIFVNKSVDGSKNIYDIKWQLFFNGEDVGEGSHNVTYDKEAKRYYSGDYEKVLDFPNFDFEVKFNAQRDFLQMYYIGVWK